MKWPELRPFLERAGIALAEDSVTRLERLRGLVLAANENLNLTRITEEGAFLEKHVLDSLLGLQGTEEKETWVDVGSGGGFPGLALAVARPRFRVLLVEAVQKKARFLEETAHTLALSNVEVAAERAEDAARQHRDAFTRASARAVGSVALCLEYLLPFVEVGGEAILYRGPEDALAEDAIAREIAPLLGGGEPVTNDFILPSGERRRILRVPKIGDTPDRFPRRTGAASKRPLGS